MRFGLSILLMSFFIHLSAMNSLAVAQEKDFPSSQSQDDEKNYVFKCSAAYYYGRGIEGESEYVAISSSAPNAEVSFSDQEKVQFILIRPYLLMVTMVRSGTPTATPFVIDGRTSYQTAGAASFATFDCFALKD